MPEKSCSMDSTPISASISRRSASEFGMYRMDCELLFWSCRVLIVFFGRHQTTDLAWIRNANADQPSRAVGIFVDFFRSRSQRFVHLEHFAGNGDEQFGNGFYRFDAAQCVTGTELCAGFR